jgi:hypothetical protein
MILGIRAIIALLLGIYPPISNEVAQVKHYLPVPLPVLLIPWNILIDKEKIIK